MAKIPEKGSTPEKKGVKFTGRSAAAAKVGTPGKGARPQQLGAWRKQMRRGIVWDRKSVTYLASGSAVLLMLIGFTAFSMVRSAKKEMRTGPKPIADGIRVPSGAVAEGTPVEEYVPGDKYWAKADEDYQKWEETIQNSDDPKEVARAYVSQAKALEKEGDYNAAMDRYERVMNQMSDTPHFLTAVTAAASCAEKNGDSGRVESIYAKAVQKLTPNTPGATGLCSQIVDEYGEKSQVGRSAKALLDEAGVSVTEPRSREPQEVTQEMLEAAKKKPQGE